MKRLLKKFKVKHPVPSLGIGILLLLVFFFQNCSSQYGVSLEGASTKTASTDNLGGDDDNDDTDIVIDPNFKPPSPVETILNLTTKKNYQTRKDINSIRQEAVMDLGPAMAFGELIFSFSQTMKTSNLKSGHGNAGFDKDINNKDVLVYKPDLNYIGNDVFDFYLLFKVADKLYLLATIHAKISISDCTNVKLAIWPDHNKDGKADDLLPLGYINSYKGNGSAFANYDYYSNSAHIINGPPASSFESRVFMYQPNSSDGVYLFFYFNIDAGGSKNNKVSWDITTKRNSLLDSVIVADDPDQYGIPELIRKPQDTINNSSLYEGRFEYWENTDGGVIGPFKGTNFEIGVNVLSSGDLNKATFFSSDNKTFSLTDQNNALSSFIISFDSTSACN